MCLLAQSNFASLITFLRNFSIHTALLAHVLLWILLRRVGFKWIKVCSPCLWLWEFLSLVLLWYCRFSFFMYLITEIFIRFWVLYDRVAHFDWVSFCFFMYFCPCFWSQQIWTWRYWLWAVSTPASFQRLLHPFLHPLVCDSFWQCCPGKLTYLIPVLLYLLRLFLLGIVLHLFHILVILIVVHLC